MAASDALPAPRPLPVWTGYRTDRSAASPGRGGPPQFPPPPSKRSCPIRRDVHRGCASRRLSAPFMAFARNGRARLVLAPPTGGLRTMRQASLGAANRLVAPAEGLLTLGSNRPVSDRAASVLPGLQAAIRTGLTPAGDDELKVGSRFNDLHIDLKRWAYPRQASSLRSPLAVSRSGRPCRGRRQTSRACSKAPDRAPRPRQTGNIRTRAAPPRTARLELRSYRPPPDRARPATDSCARSGLPVSSGEGCTGRVPRASVGQPFAARGA